MLNLLNLLRMIIEKMFDRFSNGEKFAWGGINIVGWLSYLHFLSIGWGAVLTMCLGVTGTVAGGVLTVVAIDFYKEKIKPKLFKHKKEKDEKEIKSNP